MAQNTISFNSKSFLIIYLAIVLILLMVWFNRLSLLQRDDRVIPAALQPYLVSPPRPLTKLSVNANEKYVFTSDLFIDKWSFVYFSHTNCLPLCRPALNKMSHLQASFASKDFQSIIIGINSDNETNAQLRSFLHRHGLDMTVVTASSEDIALLSSEFIALFLQSDAVTIEQQHYIFLVDPKARVYATFTPPYLNQLIEQVFLKVRLFYAQSE